MEVVRMSSRHDLLDEISEKLHLNLLTGRGKSDPGIGRKLTF